MSKSVAVPRFSTCSHLQCAKPGVRGGSCSFCEQHLCAEHRSSLLHSCRSMSELTDDEWERSIEMSVKQLLDEINVDELLHVATMLNGGKVCTFKPGQHTGPNATMGCANYHAWIIFEDEQWLVRIPRGGFSDTPATFIEYLVASEYATLKFLETTKVPVAKAFGFGLISDPNNRVGVNYILMEALPGKPYQFLKANKAQRRYITEQVSEILAELSKYPFSQAGSLLASQNTSKPIISQIASNRWVHLDIHGPYDTAEAYYKHISLQYLDLIADGQLYHEFLKEAYLFHNYLHRRAVTLLSYGELTQEFFLKHVDDKGDHILIDESYNVTGIIDWQFARVVPAREAFGPSILTAELSTLYSAHVGLGEYDCLMVKDLEAKLPTRILKALTEQTELVRRFHFGLASDLLEEEVHGIIAGTLALDPEFKGKRSHEIDVRKWLEEQWIACRDDPRRNKVQRLLANLAEEKSAEEESEETVS